MLDETGSCDIAINRTHVIYMYVCVANIKFNG